MKSPLPNIEQLDCERRGTSTSSPLGVRKDIPPPSSTTSTSAWVRWIKGTGNTIADALSRNPVEDGVDELAESDVSYIGDNLSISDLLADIIVRFCTSLHSKFQIRDWLILTSVERRLVRLLAID